ncbi:MAG: DUF4846 domain-containing protein [Bacteroidales bacterium]|nr:DUF4846 domain-containing protein [Bacteroidales bacterium]
MPVFGIFPESCAQSESNLVDTSQYSIQNRFVLPPGYSRPEYPPDSFQEYLRNVELLPFNSKVKYYNGNFKSNNGIYISVINHRINVQMRLYG